MNYLTDSFLKDIDEKFEGFSFQYKQVDYTGQIPVFFITVKNNEEDLEKQWLKIVDYLGVHFQTGLEDEFAVWNIYLFFILKNAISNSLKYQIENDTFSSRKIIIEGSFTNEQIIEEHILNKDLVFGHVVKAETVFEKNDIIWKALKDKPVQKKMTDKDKAAFKSIVKALKKKSNEN